MLNVLFIGGTGQISLCCVEAALAAGHRVSIYNRSQTPAGLSRDVEVITGRFDDDEAYAALGRRSFDVVCQFIAYEEAEVRRDLATFRGRTAQYIFRFLDGVGLSEAGPPIPHHRGRCCWKTRTGNTAAKKIACEQIAARPA